MIEIKELKFPAETKAEASKELHDQFENLGLEVLEAHRLRGADDPMRAQNPGRGGSQSGPTSAPELVNAIEEFLNAFEKLDEEYGDTGAILLEDTTELADYCLRCLAELRNWLARLELVALTPALDKIIIGAALWAIRHECEVITPEPVVNALAYTANDAASTQELAAVYGLMQGLIQAVPQSVRSDLEKSNPQRPWRILLINFAIVAIRSQDVPMMLHAFGVLAEHLPEECPGFFAEAVQQAEHAAFGDEVRGLLRGEQSKWTTRH